MTSAGTFDSSVARIPENSTRSTSKRPKATDAASAPTISAGVPSRASTQKRFQCVPRISPVARASPCSGRAIQRVTTKVAIEGPNMDSATRRVPPSDSRPGPR